MLPTRSLPAAVRHRAVGAVLRLRPLRGGAPGASGTRRHQGVQAVGAWVTCNTCISWGAGQRLIHSSTRWHTPGARLPPRLQAGRSVPAPNRHVSAPAGVLVAGTFARFLLPTSFRRVLHTGPHRFFCPTCPTPPLQPRVPPLRPPGLRGPGSALLGPGRGGTALVRGGEGWTCCAGHSLTES